MMSVCLGVLKWAPATFWGCTMYPYTAALKGHLVSKGAKFDRGMTRNDFLDMKGKMEMEERMRANQT